MSPFRVAALMGWGCFAAGAAAGPVAAATPSPVVVELFTSQGCSSCPPANATLSALADRPDVLALSFGVTYWDQLGWKDTFASPSYTARQCDYAHGLRHSNVFTPQVVVQGRTDTVGQSLADVERLIRAARLQGAPGPAIAVADDQVTLSAAPPGAEGIQTADVWLVRYDPRTLAVPIRAGENDGRTLPHRDVVRELIRLGAWSGRLEQFQIVPSKDPHLRTAVLVQAGRGGPILAAAKA
jgi:hypothetical protein